jgi:hypothetical protein
MYRRRLHKSRAVATAEMMTKMRQWRMWKVMEIHQITIEAEVVVQDQMLRVGISGKRGLVQEKVGLMADERRSNFIA